MNNKLYDALEICLQEIERGVALERALARFPDLADELRPILKASLKARTLRVAPSPEVIRRGRAKLLQRASEMREAKAAPRRRVIPIFQRLALSLGLTATFLLSGTGLVGASSTALPGENLYPVKRTWEGLQLFFIFNQDTRDVVKSQFETERLHEVNELLAEGRHELIQFAGVYMQVNGRSYVSGVAVLVPANLQIPANGSAVIITGRTDALGFVELESLELLPDGVFVPVGQPVEVETESESNSNPNESNPSSDLNVNSESDSDSNSSNLNESPDAGTDSGSGSGSDGNTNESSVTPEPEHHEHFEVEGYVEALSNTSLVINGKTVYFDHPAVEGNLRPGVKVEIKGYYANDGRFIVTEIKVKRTESGDSEENSGSDSNNDNSDSTDDNGNSNSNSNDDDHNENDHNENDHHNENGGG